MKISIILGAYKSEDEISSCLWHLAKLKYSDYEILIAADCIDSEKIYFPYPNNAKRIFVECSKKRRGVVKALNSILKEAGGNVIVHFATDRRFTRLNALKKIAKHFENPKVGGILFDIKHPQKRNWNRLAVAQAVVVRIISDWRLEECPIVRKGFNMPIIVSAFRNIFKEIDIDSINDDAEFAYKILDKGYEIHNVKDVGWYAYGEPSKLKKVFNRQKRTALGWEKTGKRRKLNMRGYYFSILKYYFKNFRKYRLDYIIYFLAVYSVAMLAAKFSRAKITEVWK